MPKKFGSIPTILNSWKEIASYLGRGVRTVQRWERELSLPVHRIGKGRRSPVHAYAVELNFWRSTSGSTRSATGSVPANGAKPSLAYSQLPAGKPAEHSRRLLQGMRSLVQTVAETSVRQRQQTEVLQKRITEMCTRIKGSAPER